LGAILLGLGLGVGLYLALALRTEPEPSRAEPAPSPLRVAARGAKLAHYDERGHKVWELLAGSLEVGQGDDGGASERAVAREVTLRFFGFNEDGSDKREGEPLPILEVQAPKLTFFRTSSDLLLEGGVLARTREGLELQSERMRWEAEQERLTSQDRVRITQGENLLEGVGFEYSPREGRLVTSRAHLILVLPQDRRSPSSDSE